MFTAIALVCACLSGSIFLRPMIGPTVCKICRASSRRTLAGLLLEQSHTHGLAESSPTARPKISVNKQDSQHSASQLLDKSHSASEVEWLSNLEYLVKIFHQLCLWGLSILILLPKSWYRAACKSLQLSSKHLPLYWSSIKFVLASNFC